MISDAISFFLPKVKCLKCSIPNTTPKSSLLILSIMSQHLKVICWNKQQVLDVLKILPSLFQRSQKYLDQLYSCPWVGEEYSLNLSRRHHIQSVRVVKHHRTLKDNHLRLQT